MAPAKKVKKQKQAKRRGFDDASDLERLTESLHKLVSGALLAFQWAQQLIMVATITTASGSQIKAA